MFQKKLLTWYQAHQRMLPWRATKDPYCIWVSEIILQQTRVAQGLPYYQRFMEAFPTVSSLAQAKEQQVLRLWQGLGYYSRARNMHRCAKKIVSDYQGRFPTTYQELLSLPGIGPYTAAAISSIAFNEPAAVVDGNVYRVLARIFGMDVDITSGEGKKVFTAKANELISETAPGDFNQAMMEFGATHCTPQNPKCQECPFSKTCVALATERVPELPVKRKKQKVQVRHLHYFLIEHNNKIAMRQRLDKDIWHGLFDFYLVETRKSTKTEDVVANDRTLRSLNGKWENKPHIVKHILSHQQLQIRFSKLTVSKSLKLEKSFRFYSRKQIQSLPKPIVILRFLEKNEF